MEPSAAEPRRLRADAARNRQRLIDAAEEVFAARGLDATLDDIARHAGVNVATAYRHFDSKHELARAFLQATLDRAVAMAEEAAAVEDPLAGLAQFLGQALDLMATNRGLVDVLTNDYGAEWFSQQLHDLITGPIRHLVSRGQQAGVVRPDVDATDFAVILPMLSSVATATWWPASLTPPAATWRSSWPGCARTAPRCPAGRRPTSSCAPLCGEEGQAQQLGHAGQQSIQAAVAGRRGRHPPLGQPFLELGALDVGVGHVPREPLRVVPELGPDDGHRRRDQRQPHQEGVDQHADGEADRDRLDRAER